MNVVNLAGNPTADPVESTYTYKDKDGNEKESVRTIGYFGDMKQCIKALLERYPRELSEKAQISFDEYLELLDKAYTRSEQLVNSLGK